MINSYQYNQLKHHHTAIKHFSSFSVLPNKKRKNKQKQNKINIYPSYTNHYYNNNHYIMGIFSCPCCVRPGGRRCVPGGSRCLLKFSQVGSLWQVGKCWAVSGLVSAALRQELDGLPSGIGGYVFPRITPILPAWTMPLFYRENNAHFLDNSYKRCYNKRSDNNKKVISHQTGKNGPGKRFPSLGYNYPLNC